MKKNSFAKKNAQKRLSPPQPFNNVNNSFVKAFEKKSTGRCDKKVKNEMDKVIGQGDRVRVRTVCNEMTARDRQKY